MYNLIEYSDKYSDTSKSLRQLKRDESYTNNAGNPANVTTLNSTYFKYKSAVFENQAADGVLKNSNIIVPLRYLSNFCRSLEMPLFNCKIHLELNWSKSCAMPDIAAETPFKMTNTKLYVPIATFSTKDDISLTKQLNEIFKRPVYWNEYRTKVDDKSLTGFYLDASFQGVKRLFVLDFNNTTVNVDGNPINNATNRVLRDSHRKYFLPRVNTINYNVLIDGRNFYDQPINDQIKKYDKIRKIVTGQGDNYITGCSLDYQCFKDHYQLIAVDLSKQKN